MTETKLADLIGLTELAEVLGVSKNEANAARQRHDFPAPVIKLRMGPAWDKKQVLNWVTSHLEDHTTNRFVSCAHCGGATMFVGEAWGVSGESKIRLNCYNSPCGPTLLTIGHTDDGEHIRTVIRTTKEEK